MIRRVIGVAVLAAALSVSVSAQFAVFDPANYANALLRYGQLQQQLTQLITTYQQIRTQYLLLRTQAEKLPFGLDARYRSLRTLWRPLGAPSAYGTTAPWVTAANTGEAAFLAFGRATEALGTYGGGLAGLSAAETGRVRTRYDRAQLEDASLTHTLEALGRLRASEESVETTMRRLEADAYGDDAALHTQIAVLNKINATGVTAARLAKDTNYLLVSLLEQQLLEGTERREAAVQGLNAHAAFLAEARPLLARTTTDTTTALAGFRIP